LRQGRRCRRMAQEHRAPRRAEAARADAPRAADIAAAQGPRHHRHRRHQLSPAHRRDSIARSTASSAVGYRRRPRRDSGKGEANMMHRTIAGAVMTGLVLTIGAMTARAEDYGPMTVQKTSAGNVLADANGMTVYTYDKDPKGKSVCNGQCAQNWPPVLAAPDA